jgi:hypothetical protein
LSPLFDAAYLFGCRCSPYIEQTITIRVLKASEQATERFGVLRPEHAPMAGAGIAASVPFSP